MQNIIRFVVATAFVLGIAGTALSQTSYPMITHTYPVAVQRGVKTKITVQGRENFHGVYRAMFHGDGIVADILLKPSKTLKGKRPVVTRVPLEVTVAKDAVLGVREFRLASSLGVSSIGQLVVVDHKTVTEATKNNVRKDAQTIVLPVVINGRLEAKEDVDFFKFKAKKGDHLSFEMTCARLQDKIHDLRQHAMPMLTLYDEDGRELAANDHFFFADPMLSYTAQKSGTYYLQVRESTYQGDTRWVYALLATHEPYASHIFPMAANPGQKVQVTPVGSARHFEPRVWLTAPQKIGVHALQLQVGTKYTNPAAFIVSPLSQAVENEPNNESDQANRINIPCGINGQIAKMRDLDCYRFAAKKGKTIAFQVYARRFGTQLDSTLHAVLEIMDLKGQTLASNFDTHGQSEASLDFTPKKDEDYIVRIRDLNSKGAPSSVYFITADWAKPDFELVCDPDKAMIGPGTSTSWFFKLTRKNGFTGAVNVEIQDLPAGVAASPLTIPESMTEGVIVLTAAKDAKIDAKNVKVIGAGKAKMPDGKETTITREVQPNQEIYSPGGGRAIFPVQMQTVAVTESSDILRVEVSTTKVSLKPGQEVKIDITVHRRPDYKKNVSLDVLLRHLNRSYGNPLPPGVTIVAGKSKTLLGKGSKGHIVLKAANNAKPIDNVPISVMAHVSINFVVKVSYSSEPILVSVGKK